MQLTLSGWWILPPIFNRNLGWITMVCDIIHFDTCCTCSDNFLCVSCYLIKRHRHFARCMVYIHHDIMILLVSGNYQLLAQWLSVTGVSPSGWKKHVSTCEEIHAARPATSCSCRRMGIWDKCASYLIAMRASMFKTFRTASLDHATVVWRSPITSIFIGMIGQNPNIHLKPKYPRPLPSALGLWSLNDWVSQKCW